MNVLPPGFFATAAPAAFTPAVFGSTGTDGNNQTISGGGLIASFVSTGSADRASARTTSTRNSGIRQCNFRFTGSSNIGVFGLQTTAAPVNNSQLYDSLEAAAYNANGNVYQNSGVLVGLTGGAAMAMNTWYSLWYDFTSAANNLKYYDNTGTLLGTCTFSPGALGTPLHLGAGAASGTVTGTCIVEIDPAPTTLYGSAVKWDS